MSRARIISGKRRTPSRKRKPHSHPRRQHARPRRLAIELLEDRRVLSVVLQMLGDLTPGPDSTAPTAYMEVGEAVFFRSFEPVNNDLWISDGTLDGTVRIPMPERAEDTFLFRLRDVDGTLAFIVHDDNETWDEADDRNDFDAGVIYTIAPGDAFIISQSATWTRQ